MATWAAVNGCELCPRDDLPSPLPCLLTLLPQTHFLKYLPETQARTPFFFWLSFHNPPIPQIKSTHNPDPSPPNQFPHSCVSDHVCRNRIFCHTHVHISKSLKVFFCWDRQHFQNQAPRRSTIPPNS